MHRTIRSFPLEIRQVSDKGAIEGHASVFGEVNAYGERVLRGAFANTIGAWNSKKKYPPLLWQHHPWEPLGPITDLEETPRGLFMRAQLLVDDVERAREARALLKSDTISGLSIGFNVPDGGEATGPDGIREVSAIDLWEVSVVTFAAGPTAEVDAVHSAFRGRMPTVREFEGFLRDAGFSRSHATTIASRGLASLQRDVRSGKAQGAVPLLDGKSIVDLALKVLP